MDVAEAQKFVSDERGRSFWNAARLSDDELLLRRERLHNGLAMVFAFALLIGYFMLPTIWGRIGENAAIYGTWANLAGFFLAAVQQSDMGNKCRSVREFLKAQSPTPSA